MTTPGQTLENPVTGERFTFIDTAATTAGGCWRFDFALRPGGAVPMPHVHPIQTERFEVVAGRMRFRVGRRTRIAEPGDVVEVAPGVMHSSRTPATTRRAYGRGPPGAGRWRTCSPRSSRWREAGRLTRRGMPRNLLDLAALARRYDQVAHAPLLSVGVQRLLLAPLVLARRHQHSARVAGATSLRNRRPSVRMTRRGRLMITRHRVRSSCSAAPARPAAASPSACGRAAGRSASARARHAAVRLGGPRRRGRPRCGRAAAYVSYFPDLAVPGAPEAVGALAAARRSGVERLVLLSGRGEEEAQRAEASLQAPRADWTIVRCSWFAQNFSEGYLLDPVLAASSRFRSATCGEPFVDADDIADVAVAALTEDGHAGQLYEVTGPRALTFAEAVEEIGARAAASFASCRSRSTASPPAGRSRACRTTWSPCCATCSARCSTAATSTSATASRARLGRPPRDFADYARAAAASGAWGEPPPRVLLSIRSMASIRAEAQAIEGRPAQMVMAADYPFMDVLWSMIIFFFWVIWIWIVITVLIDIFRRHDIGGWAKAAWVIFVVILPWLGVLVSDRPARRDAGAQMKQAQAQKQEFDEYVRETAGGGSAAEIAKAKELLDSGAITQQEFEALKAKALA